MKAFSNLKAGQTTKKIISLSKMVNAYPKFNELLSRITPELTGRGHNADTAKFSMKDKLTRAPVE